MNQFQHVNFLPWVGKNYNLQDFKIMHLGHSFYLNEEDEIESTNNNQFFTDLVVTNHISNKYPQQSYSKAMNIITDDEINEWNNIIFSNYYQKIIGSSARDKQFITQELKIQSEKSLFEIIDKYTPNLIIAWGSDLYNQLPEVGGIMLEENLNIWQYKQYPNVYFWQIYHPSSIQFNQYDYKLDFKKVKDFIKNY